MRKEVTIFSDGKKTKTVIFTDVTKTKKVTLSDGTRAVVYVTHCMDGSIEVDCDIELTEEQFEEILEMDFVI